MYVYACERLLDVLTYIDLPVYLAGAADLRRIS
jgi:hypothetical protein